MLDRLVRRRAALIAVGAAAVRPLDTLAALHFRLATAAAPPLTSAPGQPGFLDLLAQEVFGRVGIDASLVVLPGERALINANAGIEDGDMFRTPGFESGYPNLVQVAEKLMDLEFVALALRADVRVRQWSDLEGYNVVYATGRKIFERNLSNVRETTTVRALPHLFPLLANGGADVILLDWWQGARLARQSGLAVRVMEPPLASEEMFIYLHRKHQAWVAPLAAALAGVKRDGTWQRLHDRTLGRMESKR
ncbi:MAG: transporter substrate-binding domain-containing protein [Rhizobacter sp.]|nr:transporter substrate-binding domain-containing protein [Rhizobacter sp.]